jgi:hypothetical protein
MDISSFAATPPPPAGDTAPGDLYVDLESRTLWLGVDEAVNAAGAVLVSDIVGLLAEIEDARADATAYTNTQILTRAPTVHSHVSTDIVDFTGAVTAVASAIPSLQYVRGMIMMWSGAMSSIGVGALAGWALCDGSQGTPDLRDRFIIGAGNMIPGTLNPSSSMTTSLAGAHTPVIHSHVLSEAQMPYHAHSWSGYFNTGTESHDHAHHTSFSSSGGTDVQGAHNHPISGTANVPDEGGWGYRDVGTAGPYYSGVAGAHSHNVTVSGSGWSGGRNQAHYHGVSVSGTTTYAGSNHGHAHGANAVGDHSHTILSGALRNAIPYFALAFIMKL